jgi:hypothetical protein
MKIFTFKTKIVIVFLFYKIDTEQDLGIFSKFSFKSKRPFFIATSKIYKSEGKPTL